MTCSKYVTRLECALLENTLLMRFCSESYSFLSISRDWRKSILHKEQILVRQAGFMQGESTENILC